ncbi:phosphopantetheine adenylyltransferase [Balneicella halophila]|uniref:Phosphopantetheine adenylyltransferase n=1 Tax=Balneicella halophila TaxID=1537566 RepID=A0A7L4URS8_BALHA|nr:pantetheine-phosphate adenylyltransferase [Balneicella halophila]PVX52460.1 phosphopantetheine adenylyltransferase [Balneicella halophila]
MSCKEKVAIFPGSFDPFTTGHEYIVNKGVDIFDKIIIGVGFNATKKSFFPLEQRIKWIETLFANEPKISVESYEGLTIDFAQKHHASYILRGLRTSSDFEYERAIAQMNKALSNGLESIFLLTPPELTPVTSTIVRDIIRHGGDASMFIPDKLDKSEFHIKNALSIK